MNKGKVRIYELSKELKLESKDILEICSELSITAKSHSSTITEPQAENIRAAAKNYIPSHPSKSKEYNQIKKRENQSSMSQLSSVKKENLKQEILAVHKHHRPSTADSIKAETNLEPVNLLTPPQPLNAPSTPSLEDNQLEQESRPELKGPPARTNPPSQKESEFDSSEKIKTVKKSPKPSLIDYEDHSYQKTTPEIKKSSEKLKKPTLKLNLGKGKNLRQNKQKNAEQQKITPELKSEKPKLFDKSLSHEISNKLDSEIEKPKPKLQQPPQRPKLFDSDLEIEDLEETTSEIDTEAEDIDPETLLLDKPKRIKQKHKRPVTKGNEKTWDDEEIESEKKVSKFSTKGKRRSLTVEDEDEDFEELNENNNLNIETVSLALARPVGTKSPPLKSKEKEKITKKPRPKSEKTEVQTQKREKPDGQKSPEKIFLSQSLTLRELAERLNLAETEIIKLLFFKGIPVNITETLDLDTAKMVAQELNVKVETEEEKALATKTEMLAEADLENLHQRPPVVTIMGHVDHGKTTLLDSIRKTKVAQGEAGGITQHIGAYHVDVEHEGTTQQIVFLDTPGHEAFTAMRARGTKVTDIAVLVVAADDGVQPQTREAISHAKAAQVPIVVAINKMDKPESNPDRVKNELMELGLVAEDWGGDTIMVPVSALKGENLDLLLEMIVLVSEMEELSANPDRQAKGTVIEAHLDRAKGPVASLLVQNGTLRIGDIIVAGSVSGKIRAMIDDRGNKVEQATPSFAVEVLGLSEVPAAGDEFDVYNNEKEAKAIAESRAEAQRTNRLQQSMSSRRVTLSTLSEQAQQGELKELNLILKADLQGSAEAILGSLKQLPQKEVQIRVLLSAAGEITETDVDLAAASGAVIIGFNTSLAPGARQAAEQEGVDIREYNVIYKLLDEIQGAMEGLLDPEEVEESLGVAQVRAVFAVGRGAVAGCYVQSGKVVRNRFIRVVRQGEVLYQGNLDSLRRVKEDVKEVNAGYECGIATAKFNDWQEGDLIEAYEMVFKRRSLSQ
jgi:translation initiation factor IF-2